ncbi:hypothetical protein [Paenibacillus borealis]|uniref:Lipoprotein n=1 Tax=Paenibacillus borealis TaxID=160799 RepID=A0A089LC11_PAEBO|nr:hypothetical protein [Paenibacillus borealis]AIQ58347.1 hypothetical protein PBOR_16415 [Paenibacillus borealis]
MNRSMRLFSLLLVTVAALSGCTSQQEDSPAPSSPSAAPGYTGTVATSSPEPAASPSAAGSTEAPAMATSVPDRADSFLGVRLIDKQGEVVREWAAAAINLFQPVRTGQNEEQELFIYRIGSEQPELLAEDGSITSWPAPQWSDDEPPYGNDYGNDILYADRLLNDEIFAVKGNRTLYLVNIITGEAKKLYSAKRPVYGLTASPDNSQAALLVASEPYIGPDADLIVLNRKGEEIFSKPKASVQSHSDGFLFIYPMAWKDSVTLAVPASGYELYGNGGVNLVHIDTGVTEFREKPSLPADLLRLFEESAGKVKFPEELHFLPEPGDQPVYYAVQGMNSDIWLLNQKTRQAVKLEKGRLLKWTTDGNLLVSATSRELLEAYLGIESL